MSSVSATTFANAGIVPTTSPNWLAEAHTQIQQSMRPGGLLGALERSKNPGSLKSFLRNSQANAETLLAVIHSNADTRASITVEVAAATYRRQLEERAALEQKLAEVKPRPRQPLDPVIYFPDGSTIDTVNNILTMVDGTRIDITTGGPVVDPDAIINLPNGAYLDTENNILTLPDGTRIDIVTGLVISV
jgi:hypothetical protein